MTFEIFMQWEIQWQNITFFVNIENKMFSMLVSSYYMLSIIKLLKNRQ